MAMKRSQRGATLVESALTLMVFFIFIFAVFEFGRAFNIYTSITDAAREAARYSVAPTLPAMTTLPASADVATAACNFLTANSLSCAAGCSAVAGQATVCVTQNCSGTAACPSPINGETVTYTEVDITAPYKFSFFPFGSINLTTKAVMRNETN